MSPTTTHPRSTRYTWNDDSLINRVEAELDADGFFLVHIYPSAKVAEGGLATVPGMLHRYGFPDAYPDVKDNKDVLVLANVKDLQKLVRSLGNGGFVSGTPTIEAVNGHVEKITEKEAVDTVKWHGRIGLVGHASILAAGLIQKPFDWGRIINAPLGAINPILMSWLGSGKDNVDVPQLMRDMRMFFAQEGVPLPPMTGEEQERGFVETAKHFLAAHPIEVGSSLGVIGSFGMIKSGINGIKAGGSGGSRIALGGINIIRDAIAVFVPEKKKPASADAQEMQGNWVDSAMKLPGAAVDLATHPSNIPNAAWDFVREAPLRMVGLLSLVSDVLYATDAADAWNKNKLFRSHDYEKGYKNKKGEHVDGRIEVEAKAHEKLKLVSELKTKYHADGDAAIYKEMNKQAAIWERLDKEAIAMKNNQLMAGYINGHISTKPKDCWRGKITPILGATTALAFLGAGVLMTMSSKSHKGNEIGAEALFSRLCSINAKILASMPEEAREPMLDKLTSYMRYRKDITGENFSADRFQQEVRSRISHMEHNPWIDRVAAQQQASPGLSASIA